ncbi:putative aaa family protein [Eutypa lata UCREL1]|uniref:Putative aaa family protein n=1 Tax=Eutypa lata (strain UCR-EL1) TaxID=1287681 RepID=M7SD34_EUTLA|nr:putative aaa family protein [Eutypa lata UCREL1]
MSGRNKQSVRFSIDSLSETNWDKSALDSVIIDEHRKDVLKALVLAHEFPSGAVDLFTQKGKGLVVLLYGSPGTGKTMTAVLLKHLEYFGGIIFLTSSLVRVFDTAMKSRIRIALEYHPPDLDMMRRIWSSAVPAVPETERELDTDEDLDKLLANRLNGREIANAVYTSRTLARYEKTKLRSEHIIKVLEAKRMFEKSFRQIQAKGRGGGAAQVSRSNTFEMAETE